jgi:hypothetical protein
MPSEQAAFAGFVLDLGTRYDRKAALGWGGEYV